MHTAPLEVYTLLELRRFLYPGKDPYLSACAPRKAARSLTQQKRKEGVALENIPASKDTHPYAMRACEPDPEPKGYEDTHGPGSLWTPTYHHPLT